MRASNRCPCQAQIKVLEQALKFAQDIERQLRQRIEHNSAHCTEGSRGDFVWDGKQKREWKNGRFVEMG